ncbi:hypothetical protein [Streptomyces sp. NBC_00464]|uniref:hypothetical protein n=1 Tax=Streptomyces sp. NBC_00464 TaxID=2975751 RepID=UPI003FA69454
MCVHDRQIYVESDPGGVRPDLAKALTHQIGGLCGAAAPGVIVLSTGLYAGDVGFVVEVHETAPALDPVWDDVMEVSYRPASERTRLVQGDAEAAWDLGLARTDYRVRYCARGMDEGRELSTRGAGEPQADSYLLQFWPAPPRPDEVIRHTSRMAGDLHMYARATARTPEQLAEAGRLTRQVFQRAAEEPAEQAAEGRRLHHEEWEWGGRLPSERLRRARESNVLGLLRFDGDLVHALDVVGPEVQRAVALLAARRACEAAGLTDVPWVARALSELAEGHPLPAPFDNPARMRETLRSDPRVPDTSVLGAIPPQRPPYVPPPSADTTNKAFVTVHPAATPQTRGLISQPHFALPAVLAAAKPAPLAAALDAVWHALNTYGEHYPGLLDEIRSVCAERAMSVDAALRTRTTPPRPVDVTAVAPQLTPLARTATRLHPRPGSPTPYESSVGGPLLWPADEPWPHCEGPHKWDGLNAIHSPEDVRQQRRIQAAVANRPGGEPPRTQYTPAERAIAERIQTGRPWPEGPIPLLPVAQLYVRDVPMLCPPEQAEADLLQVLWCPFDHLAHPETALFWRSAATVTDILDTPPEPPAIQFPGYLPEPCLLAPEQITEYPNIMELGKGLQQQLEDWRRWQEVGAVLGSSDTPYPLDSSDRPYSKDFYNEFYTGRLSVAPGWKVGGWTRWDLTDPRPRLCPSCGTEMDPLLTIASEEWDSNYPDWIPYEDRARSLSSTTHPEPHNPTMLGLAGGYGLQLHVCPVSPDHPHIELIQ